MFKLYLFLFVLFTFACCAEYYVSPTGNDNNPGTQSQPFRTIIAAVAATSSGDTINLGPGGYTESYNYATIDHPLTIIGSTGSIPSVIDGLGHTCMTISSTQINVQNIQFQDCSTSAYLSGSTSSDSVTITNCEFSSSTYGIYHKGSYGVKVNGCTFKANEYDVAQATSAAIIDISNCHFQDTTGNSISLVNDNYSWITVSDCTFTNVQGSAAIHIPQYYSKPSVGISITGCTFNSNSNDILKDSNGQLGVNVTHCHFSNTANSAINAEYISLNSQMMYNNFDTIGGEAIRLYQANQDVDIKFCTIQFTDGTGIVADTISGLLNIENVTVTGAKSSGIEIKSTSKANIINSKITNNQATNGGGVYISSVGTNVAVVSSVISGNSASSGGGGFYIDAGTLNIQFSDISNNNADTGGEFQCANNAKLFVLGCNETGNTESNPSSCPAH